MPCASKPLEAVQQNKEISTFAGKEIGAIIDAIATLRINAFKEFPYFYEGTLEAERAYLQNYLHHEHSLLSIVKINEEIVAQLTGTPLVNGLKVIGDAPRLFKQAGLAVENYYYIGEAITLEKYRNQGLIETMLALHEQKIKAWGFKAICFLTGEADQEDLALKPSNYIDFESVLKKHGCTKTEIRIYDSWPTILADGSVKEKQHSLVFWIKDL
jgi:ribosomal protein S18 acetylase RimI-like enzyme